MGYENKTQETRKELPGITGGSVPARIWQGFMRSALAGVPVTEFSEPAPIEAVPDAAKVQQRRGFQPGRRQTPDPAPGGGDRKSVGSGKSVSVRVDLGGRRIIQTKKKINIVRIH